MQWSRVGWSLTLQLILPLCPAVQSTGPAAGPDLVAEMRGGLVAVLEQPSTFVHRLLHPFDGVGDFYHTTWGQQPHHFDRSNSLPHHNADLVSGLGTASATTPNSIQQQQQAFQQFLYQCVSVLDATRGGQLQERRDITLVKRGNAPSEQLLGRSTAAAAARAVPPESVTAALLAGYSIVVNWMQFRSATIAQLAEVFESTFGYHTSVNLYHTPADAQAFLLHYDETDVFVLQVRVS